MPTRLLFSPSPSAVKKKILARFEAWLDQLVPGLNGSGSPAAAAVDIVAAVYADTTTLCRKVCRALSVKCEA